MELRNSHNFCPICQGCYEDDDFDSNMMECGRCKEWVHANCEGLTDEWYQILSFLPDSVEFVCKLCLHEDNSPWLEAISKEMQEGLTFVISVLMTSKCSKHLIHMNNKVPLSKKLDHPINQPVEMFKIMKEKDEEITLLVKENEKESSPGFSSRVMPCSSTQNNDYENEGSIENIASSCLIKTTGDSLISENNSPNVSTKRNQIVQPAESSIVDQLETSKYSVGSCTDFERPQTRSFKASALNEDVNTSIRFHEGGNTRKGNAAMNSAHASNCLSSGNEDISIKECSVRLQDICKVPKQYNISLGQQVSLANAAGGSVDSSENSLICYHSDNICQESGKCNATDNRTIISTSSFGFLSPPNKAFKAPGYLSDFDEDDGEGVKKKDKNSPYSLVAKVSKDIDDDCLSSEESSFCSSDTEIESVFEDPDEPKNLQDINSKVNEEKYKSVLQFYVDITRILEGGRSLNKAQTRNAKATFMKHMRERFPWFSVDHPNISSLIDRWHPFLPPHSDHNYSYPKPNEQTSSALSWKQPLPMRWQVSPFKRQSTWNPLKGLSSPVKGHKHALTTQVDQRKCLLCNVSGDADPRGAGRLLYLGQDEWLHVNCGLWSSEVYEEEDGGLQNVYLAVSRGRQIKCSLCLERGATVGCCHKSCQATYHFLCATDSGCFFGEDKRIFCKSHIPLDDEINRIKDLRVGRCVFVNMDSEKRRWKQAVTSKVNVVIGSLSITNLGRMVPDADSEEALIPAEFSCTRLFWSAKDPSRRVRYFCRTRVVRPVEGCAGSKGFHKTIDHAMEAGVVEREMKEAKAWLREMEKQNWVRQSRQTNIIPPQMCPLYKTIQQREKESRCDNASKSGRGTLPTRRALFSPIPSSEENLRPENKEEEVRLCVEELLSDLSQVTFKKDAHAPLTPFFRWDSTNAGEVPLFESEKSPVSHLPPSGPAPTDETNEVMTSMVNSDDNEIISMVLKDLAVFESSALQSTPSISGRLSPLDLDFLAVCDPDINPDDKLEDEGFDVTSQSQKHHEQPFEGIEAKSFLENEGADATLICQKLFEACDSQIQDHILTLERQQVETNSSLTSLTTAISDVDHHGDQNRAYHTENDPATFSNTLSVDCASVSGLNTFVADTTDGCHANTAVDTGVPHPGGERDSSKMEHSFQSCQSYPRPMDGSSSDHFDHLLPAGHCEGGLITGQDPLCESLSTTSLDAAPDKPSSVDPLPILVSNQSAEHIQEDIDKEKKLSNEFLNSEENPPVYSSSLSEHPFTVPPPSSLSIPSCSSSFGPISSGSSSTKKQVCRVLPMLSVSAGSRRSSSASNHSEPSVTSSVELSSTGSTEAKAESANLQPTETASEDLTEKKRKIHMKRNYRTVIKKYPLRSAFRKHTPYKTVQIEINETIEIPSEDEEEAVDRQRLKRKWSSKIDTESEKRPCDDEGKARSGSSERSNRKSFPVCSKLGNTDIVEDENEKRVEESSPENEEVPSTVSLRPIASRSHHRVLKFSDNHNAITVSIVNNNSLCKFAQRKRRHRYRRKTVLQLDGAADESSSEGSNACDERTPSSFVNRNGQRPQDVISSNHSNLALHIKQQSLARSSPGEEGPYKCSKCKRLYRTRDSFHRHIETCTFEIDSSTSSEEEAERLPHSHERTDDTVSITTKTEALDDHQLKQSNSSPVCVTTMSGASCSSLIKSSPTNLKKLEQLCCSPALLKGPSLCSEMLKEEEESIGESDLEKTPSGPHRQVRLAMRRAGDQKASTEEMMPVTAQAPSLSGPEVFIPPTLSPLKFSPTVKKSASPRRYTNVRLFKGRQGYQYRRAPPQLISPQQQQKPSPLLSVSDHSHQTPIQSQISSFQQAQQQHPSPPQASPMPVTIQSLVDHCPYPVQNPPTFPSPQYHAAVSPVLPQISQDLRAGPIGPITQVMTVVSGPSVAVPQGYTLQYVGSYREGDITTPTANLLSYQTPQPMVVPPSVMMTPQPTPMVMSPMINTNITYTLPTPEALVINQSPAVVPSVHYMAPSPRPAQTFQPPVIQPIGTMMSFGQSEVSPVHHLPSPILPSSISIPNMPLPHPFPANKPLTDVATSFALASPTPPSLITTCPPSPRPRPQAFVAPTSSESPSEARSVTLGASPTSLSRPLFVQAPPIVRSIATVAPAVFTTASTATITKVASSMALTSSTSSYLGVKDAFDVACSFDQSSPPRMIAAVRPRPTYSYRDAMKSSHSDKKLSRDDAAQEKTEELHPPIQPEKREEKVTDNEDDSDSEREEPHTADIDDTPIEETKDVQSYKLVLRKDGQTGARFNVMPLTGPNVPFPSPEVKELRIKAKVSVGPKRKRAPVVTSSNQWNAQGGRDLIFASKDTTNDLLVNEQSANASQNAVSPFPAALDDPSLMDEPKTSAADPYIVFELTSEDGFKVESRHVSEVWQKVLEAVSEARDNLRYGVKEENGVIGLTGNTETRGKSMSGLHMLGLTHNAVQYLLEQLPGAKDCHKYSFQFHRRPSEDDQIESASGCARSEAFKTRSPYDVFSWLASKHRRLPYKCRVQPEEIQLSTRRATSLELPMAMRYRHLCETAREAVGVFRSSIHGRGLFCKREIDSGEMVIEYAGQVIRSSLCDMREKFYESKGIGCYMFRIDEETVIDATMHGNAARFINHSCDPNCYSRVVDILGKKHIIIFALRRIQRGEELTYDYKFPIEDDKIPCSCGARRCRKYLN